MPVRLIDANALKAEARALENIGDNDFERGFCWGVDEVVNLIESAPTIEPEVQHGEWHECWHTNTVCASICTNCGKAATQARHIVGQELMTNVRYPLCPNCGAKMDGGAGNKHQV